MKQQLNALGSKVDEVNRVVADLRQVLVQLHTNDCPGTFVIVLDKDDPFIQQQAAGPGGNGGAEAAAGDGEAGAGSVHRFIRVLSDAFSQPRPLQWYQENFGKRKLRLRLVCQRCKEPQGEGYLIEKPGIKLARLAPALQARCALL